jgi:uncharacterized membrane protein YebE (DUF533 family)
MASIISYLENYVESTLGLPSDLSRFLNMIKVREQRLEQHYTAALLYADTNVLPFTCCNRRRAVVSDAVSA